MGINGNKVRRGILLLSGGLDSATVGSIMKKQEYEIISVTFDYGQRHVIEIDLAKNIAEYFKVKKHLVIKIDSEIFFGSSLIGRTGEISKTGNILDKIPNTYVPARNLLFLSFATSIAESMNIEEIFIAVNEVDYSGYPDCREEFIRSFENSAGLASAKLYKNIKIVTPIINKNKAEIIKIGLENGFDYSMTSSCYDPSVVDNKIFACGQCDSCRFRLDGFRKNSINDPILYRSYL